MIWALFFDVSLEKDGRLSKRKQSIRFFIYTCSFHHCFIEYYHVWWNSHGVYDDASLYFFLTTFPSAHLCSRIESRNILRMMGKSPCPCASLPNAKRLRSTTLAFRSVFCCFFNFDKLPFFAFGLMGYVCVCVRVCA